MPDLTPLTAEQIDELTRDAAGTTCDATVIDYDGFEQSCDATATGHRWYQGEEHVDCISPACDQHANEGGRIIAALLSAARENVALRERVSLIEAEALRRAVLEVETTLIPVEFNGDQARTDYALDRVKAIAEKIAQRIIALIPTTGADRASD